MADQILHWGGVRIRVNGSGNLNLRFIGYDDAKENVMVPLTMTSLPGRALDRLGNFVSQRARIEGKTTKINETFRINKIILYVKPIYSQYPG
jgi:hypothetical protein